MDSDDEVPVAVPLLVAEPGARASFQHGNMYPWRQISSKGVVEALQLAAEFLLTSLQVLKMQILDSKLAGLIQPPKTQRCLSC